eukprot:2762237-Rhodomonas_salina.1
MRRLPDQAACIVCRRSSELSLRAECEARDQGGGSRSRTEEPSSGQGSTPPLVLRIRGARN